MLAPIKEHNIPIIVVQGASDDKVPAIWTQMWVEAMDSLGIEYSYLEYPNEGHGQDISKHVPDIINFFNNHAKGVASDGSSRRKLSEKQEIQPTSEITVLL